MEDEGMEAHVKPKSRIRSSNIWLTLDGETKILSDWCDQWAEVYGIDRFTYLWMVHKRLKRGMPLEEAITKPPRKYNKQKRRPRMGKT